LAVEDSGINYAAGELFGGCDFQVSEIAPRAVTDPQTDHAAFPVAQAIHCQAWFGCTVHINFYYRFSDRNPDMKPAVGVRDWVHRFFILSRFLAPEFLPCEVGMRNVLDIIHPAVINIAIRLQFIL